jgi:periplasmic divalent cation tolerance protein
VIAVTGDHDVATPIEVTVTCASADEARTIIRAVVEARLAACGQTWPITSCYRWQGDVADGDEHLLLLKTLAVHFDAICEVIRSHHSYELPAIAAIPVSHAGPGYIEWIAGSTRSDE